MITWTGFLGNLIAFITNQLENTTATMTAEDKKHAGSTFLQLHEAILQLEVTSDEIMAKTEALIKGEKTRLYSHWLKGMYEKVDTSSRNFIDALDSLGAFLYKHDPALALLFMKIQNAHSRTLLKPSDSFFEECMRFKIEWKTSRSMRSISYTTPKKSLEQLDFKKQYEWVCYSREYYRKSTNKEWPLQFNSLSAGDILATLVKDEYIEDTIEPRDTRKIITVFKSLNNSLQQFEKSRRQLCRFVKNNFTIEDLLNTDALRHSRLFAGTAPKTSRKTTAEAAAPVAS
ncbi:MAG TPA: hypothetical protein ENJ29_11380 [Bacteroidetes bacterium]|nr:hypothetical protein [Bacteroidota bacterium]